jgi:hypothetical protein
MMAMFTEDSILNFARRNWYHFFDPNTEPKFKVDPLPLLLQSSLLLFLTGAWSKLDESYLHGLSFH